jgi:hypothetical protein
MSSFGAHRVLADERAAENPPTNALLNFNSLAKEEKIEKLSLQQKL